MGIVRQYLMIAKTGEGQALSEALRALAAQVRQLEGCEGIDLYRDVDKPDRFTFLEHWTSIEAHQAGGKVLGKAAFAPVSALLEAPPAGAYLEPSPLG